MKKTLAIMFAAMSIALTGCFGIKYPDSDNPTAVVIVTVKKSAAGVNSGAAADERMMVDMMKDITDDIVVIRNGKATRKNVKEAIARACKKELAIIFFSCHAGREKASRKHYEADGVDEYMYLANSTIGDDEIWELLQNSTNRVMTIFNCCHSGTMFRSDSGEDTVADDTWPFAMFGKASPTTADGMTPKFTLLSWGASNDAGYAKTWSTGGYFVKAMYEAYTAFKNNDLTITYDSLWNMIVSDHDVQIRQRPEQNLIGDKTKFQGKEAFR